MLVAALLSGLFLAAASALAAPHAPERATLAPRDNDIEPQHMFGNSASVGWYRTNGSWTGISAEIQLPNIEAAVKGGNNSVSAWVQIGGYTCPNTTLAAGIDMTIGDSPSNITYQAWYYQGSSDKQPIDNTFSDINVADANGLSFQVDDSVIFLLDETHLNITNRRSNNSFRHDWKFDGDGVCDKDASLHVGRTDDNDPALIVRTDRALYFTDVNFKYVDQNKTVEIGLDGQPLSKDANVSSGSLPGLAGSYNMTSTDTTDVNTNCMVDTPTEAMCWQELVHGTPGHT